MEKYLINKNVDDFKKRLDELSKALDINKQKQLLKINEEKMSQPGFWEDSNQSSIILKQTKLQKEKIDTIEELFQEMEDLLFYIELEDEDTAQEVETIIQNIQNKLSAFETKMLLSKEYDSCNAIIEMHPGAGGTESQDWCEMLYRMYIHYADKEGFKLEEIDYQAGDEAGIKSVSFLIKGDNAYGYLKSEQGVHRLVRISPFDSASRRHTSFCGVTITPEIEDVKEITIKPSDIRIDTFRASGAGGQHINKTDSAIRITHLETGIVSSCQNQRSQFQNKEYAMRILKAKLYQKEIEEKNEKLRKISGETNLNGFGSQIRSYVFHPYTMVKDHRTNFEMGNVSSVMDGNISGFINAYLKSEYNK